MLENIKVGDFLQYKGHEVKNTFKPNYCYPVKSIDVLAGKIHFISGDCSTLSPIIWDIPKKIHVCRHNHPCTQVVNFSDLKPGDYFKFHGKKQVFLVSDIKSRGELTYSKTNDVWGSYETKPKKWAKLVEIGFEY